MRADDFHISHAGPTLKNGNLCVELTLQNVFSREIEGTLFSGLPALIDIYVLLQNQANGKKIKKAVPIRVRHDVWKGRFYVDFQDSSQVFDRFERLKYYFREMSVEFLPVRTLDKNARFVFTVRAEVAAITKVQNDRLKDWIMNADETEEMHASDRRNPGFRFSISRLVGSMLGTKKDPDHITPAYQTAPFTIKALL